ncbi:hypothetical protein NHQ30_007017 [Ciborinia camelliae]|nr:hypothetical protein NHQ30_007017 [Ciborinia camelliae]
MNTTRKSPITEGEKIQPTQRDVLRTPPPSYMFSPPGAPRPKRIGNVRDMTANDSPLKARSHFRRPSTVSQYLTTSQASTFNRPTLIMGDSNGRYWSLIDIAKRQSNGHRVAENSPSEVSNVRASTSSSSHPVYGTKPGHQKPEDAKATQTDEFCKLSAQLKEEEKDFW